MGKDGKRILDKKTEIRHLKINLIIVLVMVFVVLTIILGFLSVYNMMHAKVMLYRVCNYIIITLTYILVAIVFTYSTLHRYELCMSKYVDTDVLTNGINYEKFLKDSQSLIENNPDTTFGVFYGDIQNFKYINDTFGYDVGDKILMFISQKIKETLEGTEGLFARISADNYTVIVPYTDKNEFVEPIYSVIDDICWFEDIQTAHYKPDIYVGIYCSGEDDKDLTISEMIDRANMAQKSIKGSSEYHIAFYTEEIRERVIAEKELERRMDTALANGEFKAYFQPKYEVSSGEIVGAEALVRWDSPETGFMSPGKFIPLFEQNGFIINLDQYVFETVCKNMRAWLDAGIKVVPVSINVSRLQFYKLDFVKRYTKIKEKYDIPDGLLELEFTESIVFENLDILRKIVLSLKKVGFSCSIDDFGSGYSSLNVLKNIPMDTLKLDKLFFDDSENIERDKALISSVISLSRALNMKTVAEGIENWAQVAFLKEIGCDIIQGYVYSEPIPHARFTNLLEGNRRKEMPAELRMNTYLDREEDSDFALAKYTALLSVIDGMIMEVDFNTGKYKFLNISVPQEVRIKDFEKNGLGFNEMFGKIVDKYVHPDDAKLVKNRCSSVSVMSSFYRNEVKIITELRLMMRKSKVYEWAKMTIVRINTDPEANDFRALLYIEPMKTSYDNDDEQVLVTEELKNAMYTVCTFIYEFNFTDMTFKKLYCDETLIGEQPNYGEIGWLQECYMPKVVLKEDIDKILEFLAPEYIERELSAGNKKISASCTAVFNNKQYLMSLTIVKMGSISHDTGTKYALLCKLDKKQ